MERNDAPRWVEAADLERLRHKGRLLFRHEGRQIALFLGSGGIHACNNRCPHEGYPLMEGDLDGGCILTCNWHNWKFDLESGETLVGGDRLRRYPVRVEAGRIFVDLADPPAAERRAAALEELKGAFRRQEYDRMARAFARHTAAGGSVEAALSVALAWGAGHLEFGTTHAFAAAPDWLALGARHAGDPAEALVPVVEIAANLADDIQGEAPHPYAEGTLPWAPEAFLAAIEAEDEAAAVRRVRGALAAGLPPATLLPVFAAAALAHYRDFGHSLIYCQKTEELIARLGPAVAEPLLLALVRSLVFSSREDLIPEFRHYAPALAAWAEGGRVPVSAALLLGRAVKGCLAAATAAAGDPTALHAALLEAVARQLLCFDSTIERRSGASLAESASWLDVTHGVTFANAVRWAAARDPSLLAPGLLQLACFVGRNRGFVDLERPEDPAPDDPAAFFAAAGRALLDHDERVYILAAHRVKLLCAAEAEAAAVGFDTPLGRLLAAAARRFLDSRVRLKQPLRSVRQALEIVAAET